MSASPRADPRRTVTHWRRAWVYALAWLPPLGVICYFLPRYAVLYAKLDEQGELPGHVHWVLAFVRLNQAYFYLPAALAFLTAVAVAEVILSARPRAQCERTGVLAWRLGVVCVVLLAWLLALAPPMLPVYRMGSVAASR
jgi:hypothetical protein